MSRARNARGHGARLREEILAAAVVLIDETGDPTLTLRGVARRAGISAPSIYDHFDDLASLVDAVIALSFEQLTLRLTAVAGGATDAGNDAEPDPVGALVAAAAAYVRFAWDHRARYRLMFAAEGYAPDAIDAFVVVQTLIGRCVDAGVSASTDPRLDTWILWAGLHGVATLDKPARAEHRRLGPLDRPAMLETMVHRLTRIAEPGSRPGSEPPLP